MKQFCRIIAGVLLLAVLITGCATVKPVARDPNAEYQLVILNTNDHHGTVLPSSGKGGLSERATYIKSVRSANPNVLLLDAGDINTGSALSNMFKAEPDIAVYNLLKYDAAAFGNHEFDNDLALLEKQLAAAKFAWLGSNIVRADGKHLGQQYLVKDFDGFRVGIFGLTTRRTLVTASPDKSLTFKDEIETAREMTSFLREKQKADIVIVLTHMGDVLESADQTTSLKLAENVAGIDLIIDGHSHTKMDAPVMVKGIPVVSANEWGKFVGTGVMKIKDGKAVSFTWKPEEITVEKYAKDAEVEALIAPYVEKAKADLGTVVATATAKFEFGNRLSRYREIALGDMVSDATTWYLRAKANQHVDFALTNGGNIRTELPAGKITKENVATVLPFDNWIFVLTMKGSDVIELFNFIGSINQGNGGFAQVSKEVRYTITYDEKGANGKISGVTINGQPIDPNKMYRIGTNDYLAGGGDGYTVLKKCVDSYNTSLTLRDITIDYMQQLPQPIDPATFVDGRITIKGGVNP